MRLTVLGTSPVRPNPGSACAGYLIEAGGARVLVDCGPGALANLLSLHPLDALDAVLVSHPHADHFFDLVGMRYGVMYGPSKVANPPPIYADDGTRKVIADVGEALDPGGSFWDSIPVRDLPSQSTLTLAGLDITFAPIVHYVDGWAMRFEADGRSLAYTADTGPSPRVAELARNVDLLLAECTLSARDDYPEEWGHLAPQEAGEMANASGARKMLLTHYWAENDPAKLVLSARQTFAGPVAMAQEMETYVLD